MEKELEIGVIWGYIGIQVHKSYLLWALKSVTYCPHWAIESPGALRRV